MANTLHTYLAWLLTVNPGGPLMAITQALYRALERSAQGVAI